MSTHTINDHQHTEVTDGADEELYFSVTEEKLSVNEFVCASSSITNTLTSNGDFTLFLLKPNASFHEAHKLCASLSIHKFVSLAQTEPQSLQLLLESLTSFIEDKTSHVIATMRCLKPMIGCDAQAVTIIAYLDCVSTCLSLYSFIMDTSRHSKHFNIAIKPIREEQFAPAVMIAHEFFVKFLNGHKDFSVASDMEPNTTTNMHSSSPSKGARGQSKKDASKETLDLKSKRSFNAMLEMMLPSFSHLFTYLRHFTYACFPTGKIAYILIELSFAILKIDQQQMQRFGVLLHKHYASLLTLYHAASLLLRIFYKHSDTYREHCNTLFVESLHHLSSSKSTWKPFLMDENSLLQQINPYSSLEKDENHQIRISSITYAMLTCLQCLGDERNSVELNDRAYYSGMKEIITDLLQRCCDKDLSDDYFTTLTFLVQEMLHACKSIFHPVSVLLLQLLSLSICMELQVKTSENNAHNIKRDISSINQLLEVVGSIAEGLAKFQIDWETRSLTDGLMCDTKSIFSQLQSHIVQQLTSKWKLTHPNYMDMLLQIDQQSLLNDDEDKANTSNDYWLSDYSSVFDKPSLSANENNSISFVVALDTMFEINNDVNDIVFEAQSMSEFNTSTADRQFLQKQLIDGCVTLTMSIVVYLMESQYPVLQRVVASITETDIRYIKILRLYIQKVGWAALTNDSSELYSQNNQKNFKYHIVDERCRDTCIALCHAWQKTRTQNHQDVKALLHMLLHPSHQNYITQTSRNVNIHTNNFSLSSQTMYKISQSSLPGFLSAINVKPELLSVIQEAHMLLFNPQARSLVYKLIEQLLHFLQDTSPIVRARILKQLTRIASVDMYILSWKTVKLCLEQTLQDRAISVREESVKLIANYILQKQDNPSSQSYYLSQLIPLMHDEGISVRKSVLSVLRDTLLAFPFHAQYREICVALLARVAATQEEDSVKEFIGHIFQQLWFLPPSQDVCETLSTVIYNNTQPSSHDDKAKSISDNASAASNNIAGKKIDFIKHLQKMNTDLNNKKSVLREMPSMHVRFTALQLIELLLFHDESRTWILSLLQSLLHGNAAGHEKHDTVKMKRQQSIAHCEKIIAFCIELSLCCEERHESLMSYLQHYNDINDIHDTQHHSVSCETFQVSIMACIAMFATAHPPFITEISYFLPYLHVSHTQLNRHNMALAGHVLRILQSTALLQRTQLQHYCLTENPQQSLFQDLSQVALRHSTDNVSLAVSCMATLVTHVSKDATPLFQLAKMCFVPLQTIAKSYAAEVQRVSRETHVSQGAPESQITLDTAQRNMFRRCLTVLGALCLHLRQCRSQWDQFACRDTPNQYITPQQQYACEEQAARCPLAEAPPLHPLRLYGSCFSATTFALSLMKTKQVGDTLNEDKHEEEDSLSLVAVSCLCHIFTGYPPLMDFARRINLLDELFDLPSVSPSANTYKITTAFLKALNEMLIEEETRLETKSQLQAMREAGVSLTDVGTHTDSNKPKTSKTNKRKDGKHSDTILGHTHDTGRKLSARENVLGAGNSGDATQVDSTLGGFILHQYLSCLKQFLRDSYHCHLLEEHSALRHASLALIGTLLRQGMINPAEVIADLVMLQGHCIDIHSIAKEETHAMHLTENELIANDALQILLLENERHPTFVEAKYLEGIELWFDVTWSRFSHVENSVQGPAILFSKLFSQFEDHLHSMSIAEMFIPSFVKLFAHDRKKTLRIVASLLDKCVSKPTLVSSANSHSVSTPKQFQKWIYEHSVKQLVKVEFFSVLLGQWPYASSEEALFILSYLSRHVPVDMTTALNALLPLLTQLGFTLTDTVNDTTTSSRTQVRWEYIAVSLDVSHFVSQNTQHIHDTSVRAFFLTWTQVYQWLLALRTDETLLRLRAFLKTQYQLSDERCQLYRTNDTATQYEKYNVSQWRDASPVANCVFLPCPPAVCLATHEGEETPEDTLKMKPLRYFQWKNNDVESLTRHIVPVGVAVTRDFERCHRLLFHEPQNVACHMSSYHKLQQHFDTDKRHDTLYFEDDNHNNSNNNSKLHINNSNKMHKSSRDTVGHTHSVKTPNRSNSKANSKKRSTVSRPNSTNKRQKRKPTDNDDWYDEDNDRDDEVVSGGAKEGVFGRDSYFEDKDATMTTADGGGKRDGLRRRVNRVNYAAFAMMDEDDLDGDT